MSTLPRPVTSPELVKLRSDNQSARLYVLVDNPPPIYTARLAAVPPSTDSVATISYSSGAGAGSHTYTDVLADMQLLVGTAAGAYDLGLCRLRNTSGIGATSGSFNIGETSEINWQSGCYLTIVDFFPLEPRHIRIDPSDGTTPLMDYDVAYTNQNETAGASPMVVMGGHCVLWLRGATVSIQRDASNSWVKDGSIASFAWTAAGASATSGMATATPTITYNAVGRYRIDCIATGNNGVSEVGHRYVFVLDPYIQGPQQFYPENTGGDSSSGGWSLKFSGFTGVDRANVPDRALCILHAREWYGDTEVSIGYVTGEENIICAGYINAEAIDWKPAYTYGQVHFEVQGPQFWLDKKSAFPSGVKDVPDSGTVNKWTKFKGLTLNKAWYHFMRWCSTASRMMDVYPCSDTRRIPRLEAPGGQTIWQQLIQIADKSIFARPICDHLGRMFLQIEHQLIQDRSSFPTVMDIAKGDWREETILERRIVPEAALVDMSGVAWDGVTATPVFSLAPGHVFKGLGSAQVVDHLAIIDQATANVQAGLYLAWKNNQWPKTTLKLAADNRMIDIAPYQRLTATMQTTDTPRGIGQAFTFIPRGVSLSYKDGYLLTDVTVEAEVAPDLAITGDTPPQPPAPPPAPVQPPLPPPVIDPAPNNAREVWMLVTSPAVALYWSSDFFKGGQPTWNTVGGAMPDTPSGSVSAPRMRMALDGSAVYLIYDQAANKGLYKCTNPKAMSPTWVDILVGEKFAGTYPFQFIDGNRHHGIYDYILWATPRAAGADLFKGYVYGTYNGVSWTWNGTQVSDLVYSTTNPVDYAIYSDHDYRRLPEDTIISHNTTDDVAPDNIWSFSRTSHVAVTFNDSTGHNVVVVPETMVLVNDFGAGHYLLVNGSYHGNKVFVMGNPAHVGDNGNYWIGNTSGVTFKGNWPNINFMRDALLSGGGPLVAAVDFVLANNEFIRINRDGTGNTWEAMSGNFWSITSGNQTIADIQLVF